MPETITKPHELEELPEHQRALAQLRQAEEFTMGGHVRSKLRTMRERLRKTLSDGNQLDGSAETEADDDMQILARDITFHAPPQEKKPDAPAVTQISTPQPAEPRKPSRWPLAAALALGMGTPTTAAIIMAPKIIEAWNAHKPAVVQPHPEYAPILLPGKPNGVK